MKGQSQAGELRHWIKIITGPVKPDRNSLGEADESPGQVVCECWAKFEELTGSQIVFAQQLTPETTARFTIRWRAGITDRQWVEYRGRSFWLTGPPIDPTSQQQWLVLNCAEYPGR